MRTLRSQEQKGWGVSAGSDIDQLKLDMYQIHAGGGGGGVLEWRNPTRNQS